MLECGIKIVITLVLYPELTGNDEVHMGMVKILLGFIVFVAFMVLLQTQSVIDMLFLFAAAGVVPGTNLSLSPETSLLVVGLVVVAGLIYALRRPLVRSFGYLFLLTRQLAIAVSLYTDRYAMLPLRSLSARLHAAFGRRAIR